MSDDLGNFAVITGKNGSGKSQLIQILGSLQYPYNSQSPYSVTVDTEMKNLQVEGIALSNVGTLKGEHVAKQIEASFNSYNQINIEVRKFYEDLFKNGLKLNEIAQDIDIRPFMSGNDVNDKNRRVLVICQQFLGGIDGYTNDEAMYERQAKKISSNLFNSKKNIQYAKFVAAYKNKNIFTLDKNDFFSSPINEIYFTTDTPFSIQIQNLFYGYARKRFTNEMEFNRKSNYGHTNQSIPDSEFVSLYPPPWTQINKILEKHNLKFRVVEIKIEDFAPEIDFDFHLIDISNNQKIILDELSSGEKIIVGLIIRLFLTERYKDELRFPDCMIFDEPDAFLHPEMSSLLLDVLYNTFVKDLGIKVLFTTHSPSTVALAPEDCIFELNNVPTTILRKITKNEALKVLTENLPLLSVDYSNHRQVFVESPTDQYYFQLIFNKLKAEKKTLFDLYFITTGYGKSNCAEVIKLTTELRNAGNKTSFGIIDWDSVNESTEFIKVNGYKKRYSVENFILDPIYLCILFIEQKCANNISELGFDVSYNQFSLANETEERLQEISDWFFKKVEIRFPNFKFDNLQEIDYSNGKKIKIPDWYLKTKGHDVEDKIKDVFPSLAAFRNEGELQKKLTEIASKCYPFISVEPIELLTLLSNK